MFQQSKTPPFQSTLSRHLILLKHHLLSGIFFFIAPLVCVCHGIFLMPTIQNPRPSVWNAKPEAQTKTRRPYRRRQDNSKWHASQVEPITNPLIANRHKCPNEL